MTFHTNTDTMISMKHFVLIFTAIILIANTLVVSAWAKPCVGMIDAPQTAEKVMMMDGEPCHDDNRNEKSSNKHCDGVCLCFHVSINQTPTLANNANISMPLKSRDIPNRYNEQISSYASAPPSPPPKHYS